MEEAGFPKKRSRGTARSWRDELHPAEQLNWALAWRFAAFHCTPNGEAGPCCGDTAWVAIGLRNEEPRCISAGSCDPAVASLIVLAASAVNQWAS